MRPSEACARVSFSAIKKDSLRLLARFDQKAAVRRGIAAGARADVGAIIAYITILVAISGENDAPLSSVCFSLGGLAFPALHVLHRGSAPLHGSNGIEKPV